MQKFFLITIILVFIGVMAFSCNEDESTENIEQINIQILTGESERVWKMTSFTIDGVDSIQDCDKDNTWVFNADNTLTITLNKLCTEEEDKGKSSDSEKYAWKLTNDGRILDIRLPGDGELKPSCLSLRGGTIEQINDTSFKIGVTLAVVDNGVTSSDNYQWTYTKQ